MALNLGVNVNPRLLQWARETAGVELENVAKRLHVRENTIREWEQEGAISYSKLENLADFYKRPLAVFFMADIPIEPSLPTDFRAPQKGGLRLSKDVRLAIRQAQHLQGIYQETLESQESRKNIGHAFLTETPESLAKKQRERIGITWEMQKKWKSGSDTLKKWIEVFEGENILVFQMGMPSKELSGFSLSEGDAPRVIVVNSQDAYNRRIFTLFHEYCHLLLNSGGICKLRGGGKEIARDMSLESFCDRFAASFLVPADDFFPRKEVQGVILQTEDDKALRRLSGLFKVSREVILLRIYLTGKITWTYYQKKKKLFDAEFEKIKKKRKPGGPLPHIKSLSENGRKFTSSAIRAYKNGKITGPEISDYLGVKLRHIPLIEGLL